MTNEAKSSSFREVAVFSLLVAIGVAGRWGQPDWEFTPIAAASIFAGCYFSRAAVAALVPIAILSISDLLLPAYSSLPVFFVKYVAMALPVVLGRWLARCESSLSTAYRWGLCGLAPATVFYLTTNFAVWAFQSDYAKTFAGLMECYAAGVPFFRSMLAGDIFYLCVLFVCAALAGQRAPATEAARFGSQ